MKKRFGPFVLFCSLLILLCISISTPVADAARVAIRVACVGNSITYGAGIEDRDHNSYPAQLARRLGRAWDVRNFGVSGATLLKKGDKPYWQEAAFDEALAFNPDVVVIKLGTNDSKPQNWKHKGDFYHDYLELIRKFKALPANPTIYICTPVPAYADRWGIRDEIIVDEQIPTIRRLARNTGSTLIDLYVPLSGKEHMFPDMIHPDRDGAAAMAREIYRYVSHS